MRKLTRAFLSVSLVAAGVTGASAFFPSPVDAGVYAWGMSNLGETCGGTCGSSNICCRITIVDVT